MAISDIVKNTKTTTRCMLLICALMLLTGIVVYYLYLRPESLTMLSDLKGTPPNRIKESFFGGDSPVTTIPCPCAPGAPQFNSIISKFSGIGINVTPVTQQGSSTQQLYLINTIPINSNAVLGSVYAVDNTNKLTTVIQNMNDVNQYWTITSTTDASGTDINLVEPYIQKIAGVTFALQYENGNLSIRPFNNTFESQHWLTSTTTFNLGIPVVVVNPASIYTPEFAQVGNFTPGSGVSTSLDSQNNQQVNNVINLIQAGVQQYMSQLNQQTNGSNQISSSSLGNGENPLNINVAVNGGVKSISPFADVSNSGSTPDVLTLLNQYEQSQSPSDYDNYRLYKKSDLEAALQKASPMSAPDVRDYVSKTISTCNCKM